MQPKDRHCEDPSGITSRDVLINGGGGGELRDPPTQNLGNPRDPELSHPHRGGRGGWTANHPPTHPPTRIHRLQGCFIDHLHLVKFSLHSSPIHCREPVLPMLQNCSSTPCNSMACSLAGHFDISRHPSFPRIGLLANRFCISSNSNRESASNDASYHHQCAVSHHGTHLLTPPSAPACFEAARRDLCSADFKCSC